MSSEGKKGQGVWFGFMYISLVGSLVGVIAIIQLAQSAIFQLHPPFVHIPCSAHQFCWLHAKGFAGSTIPIPAAVLFSSGCRLLSQSPCDYSFLRSRAFFIFVAACGTFAACAAPFSCW